MFMHIWTIMYQWFYLWLDFSKKIVDFVSIPFGDLVDSVILVEEGTLIETVLDFIFLAINDMSLIQLMFGAGLPLLVIFIVCKFFVGLLS